ncbi:M20 family metallopeptidase [candidate division KSB1 bacterium]
MNKKRSLSIFIIILLFAGIFSNLTAQEKKIKEALGKFLQEITELRHHLHQYPELGNREFKTAKIVADHCRKNGLEVTENIAHTGVVAILKGGKPGPVVAVRADMDALPIIEETDIPYRSEVKTEYRGQEVGVMHACGHDVHTAVQLGVVSVLASMKNDIPGTIKFIFQPAEEGSPPGERGGAYLMVEEGVLKDPAPEAIFGLHTGGPLGYVGYSIGPALAAVDNFSIIVRGKQAHGASPDQSVDPIVTASQVVLALQTIRARNLSPLQPSVITIGIFRSGNRSNIIPREAYLEGTVRTYDPEIRNSIEKRMREITDGITSSAGATFELNYRRGSSATINDPVLTNKMLPTLKRILGEDKVVEQPPLMGSEDFSNYANIIPGFFFFLGHSNPDNPGGPHHNPKFLADDGCLSVGIKAMSNLVMDYLRSGGLEK